MQRPSDQNSNALTTAQPPLLLTLSLPRVSKIEIQDKYQISFCKILKYLKHLIGPCESTAKEVSFEWSHYRISSTDSNTRTTLHVSMSDSGSERVKNFEQKEGHVIKDIQLVVLQKMQDREYITNNLCQSLLFTTWTR